ncbi:ZYBA0S12-01464g1_1 [Zygosaccharomyces bailii CLIB 213]|uniref:ZYBA0S12-01464g1_1 n=1 Tax=Zygosaccharomyces bailii (strain CLIB 213 / ATCC 58445 / CBS 680 / BCRC 21525 / NBRC 1098 / NCYC 1416 / NRRL Y-2227) TaxID=1333698 RepID=A0A8J2TAT0_ZYGB2|nr:ZYBA0S12-01464g1_1 [Zygosaccharomyces bailii CLIB 213]
MSPSTDLSVPPNLPLHLRNQISELVRDYKEENLTLKGYEAKRKYLLDQYANGQRFPLTPIISPSKRPAALHVRNQSWGSSIRSHGANYYNDVNSITSSIYQGNPTDHSAGSETPYMYQRGRSHRHSLYRVTTVHSNSSYSTPKRRNASSVHLSIPSNEIAGVPYNPMIPLLPREENPSNSDSLTSVLRGRFERYPGEIAMISVNEKGKETSITWDKLYLKAEKVAHILSKEKLYKMDKVLLWYNKSEVIDFTVALLGCFIAGMVAVPVSFETYSLGEITEIIKLTSSKSVLISEECYGQLENLYSTSNHNKIKVIKSEFFAQISFIKTDDLGQYSKAKKIVPTFDIPNISYIEFTRTPLGRLSGVVMKHKTLFNQYNIFANILNSRAMPNWKKHNIKKSFKSRDASAKYTILNSLDATRSTGLVLGVFFNIFSGNLLICMDHRLLQKPGAYENMIAKYKADLLLNEQLQLKQVVINYLEDPQSTISKKHRIDLSCIKCCLTCCTTIDTDVTDMIVQKWLKNLGCIDASTCYSPVLTLPDFGGIFLSVRDQLGKLDNFQIHEPALRYQDELYVNKEKLRGNVVEPSITAMRNSSSSKDYLRVTTFGFPIPDAILCVVNPDDNTLVPDLTVGELLVHSASLTDEFYQMDRVNNFVFKARLNYPKMYSFLNDDPTSTAIGERLSTIKNICPPSLFFLRTKLMGFVHNGKIYVLSMVEDMFLQNQLIRLPNWAHTSDVRKGKKASSQTIDTLSLKSADLKLDKDHKGIKRVVQTYYLQQVTETLVRAVSTVYDVSAFELNHNKDEHFLVVVVESSLSKITTSQENTVLETDSQKRTVEQKMNELTEQVYRILWIFHKIQPVCVMVVPLGTLPKRYCSLEIANSTVEKKFLSGELPATFAKFQFDNVILDFVPHSLFYNESIFSEHLSNLRRNGLLEEYQSNHSTSHLEQRFPLPEENPWQTSGIDYRETSVDLRTQKKLTDFHSVLDILEWRIKETGNEFAFSDGATFGQSPSNENSHKKVSWKAFERIVASFLRKIIESKSPLKRGDRVVVMCENSVEYVAMVIACFYCNLVVIPYPALKENNMEEEIAYFVKVVRGYNVKRIFMDLTTHNLFEDNPVLTKVLKKYKHYIPKITVFSKVKKKNNLTINMFCSQLKQKFGPKPGTNHNSLPCVVWIDDQHDIKRDTHVTMTHSALLKSLKILKETLGLTSENPIFSLCSYTVGIGFMLSCMAGIYVGCTTSLFSLGGVSSNPSGFFIGLQNMNVKDLYLNFDAFCVLMEKASELVAASEGKLSSLEKSSKKHSPAPTLLRPDFLRNVQNLMIPFSGRPNTKKIEELLRRNPRVFVNATKINYVYHNHFNPHISFRSYLGSPPVDLYLDSIALREGLIKTVNPAEIGSRGYIRVQDSGIVAVCTEVSIVNPETNLPCTTGEIGEIWCCSEGNAHDYYICQEGVGPSAKPTLRKDPFITNQFRSKLKTDVDNGLTYLRTGDLGFIRRVFSTDNSGNKVDLNLLFVLGSINETVEILGLTHFVKDLERTVKHTHSTIQKCILAKAGGLLVCLVKCRDNAHAKCANLAALIVSELLKNHGVVLDLCAFAGQSTLPNDWETNRATVMEAWLDQEIQIEAQFGINYGENISIYLLSEFERTS